MSIFTSGDDIIVVIDGVGVQGPAGEGVPEGGLTSQILVKNSDDNFDTTWIDATLSVTLVSTDPITGVDGETIYNTTTNQMKIWVNGAWSVIGGTTPPEVGAILSMEGDIVISQDDFVIMYN